jgi:tetratricopeptide (TPR) repeat protein
LIWAGLAGVTLLAYAPALAGGFLWDDNGHVTRPALRSLHGLGRIWMELGATQQYYPVLHSAFWLEHRLWGDCTLGYHLLNVLLHATAAFLFGLALRQVARPRAAEAGRVGWWWVAALIFALHPVCVESVAWISEQKNTLSAVFYLMAALTYLRWREGDAEGLGGGGLYLGATGLFILALLSKSVTATLPAALLVVAWWQRGSLSWRRDFVPLLPWLALGLASGLLTAWVERHFGGAEGTAYTLGGFQRCVLAGRVTVFYLSKLFWPANLVFIYPHWDLAVPLGGQVLYPVGVAGALAVLGFARERARGPLAALLFFMGTLFPALGFVNVFPFVYSYVADHFQYLASLGIIALVCGGAEQLLKGGGATGGRAGLGRSLLLVQLGTLVVIVGLGILTYRQSRMYRDLETLYRTTLSRNPQCWMAESNLGLALAGEGRLKEAVAHYVRALEIDPTLSTVHNDLGSALMAEGRVAEALAQFAEASRLRPGYAEAIYNSGVALQAAGRTPEAIEAFSRALRLRPGFSEAHYTLAIVLAGLGRTGEAVEQFTETARLRPDFAEAHFGLGTALAGLGRLEDGAAELREAVRLNPDFAEAHYNLGAALQRLGRDAEARVEYAQARRLGFPR